MGLGKTLDCDSLNRSSLGMSDFLSTIKPLRPDISDWVVHFTQGTAEPAKKALKGILDDGLKNFGKGICFSESPITQFSNLFKIFEKYENPRFAPYGVAVKKEWLFQKGGRPVINLPEQERQYLNDEISWLFEEYVPQKRDFTWQREWRVKEATLPLSNSDTIVIVPNLEEAAGLAFDWEAEYEYEGPDEYSTWLCMDLQWPFITLDKIKSLEGQGTNDEIILKLLADLHG